MGAVPPRGCASVEIAHCPLQGRADEFLEHTDRRRAGRCGNSYRLSFDCGYVLTVVAYPAAHFMKVIREMAVDETFVRRDADGPAACSAPVGRVWREA